MSFWSKLFRNGDDHDGEGAENESAATNDVQLAPLKPVELAALESSSVRSIEIPANRAAAVAADMLIPAGAAAAQAAGELGMAVVKFPEGVGWADLCVRKSDGWNLLANFKGGKFNDMAGIKQAGLQPAAAANLALQGAAVAVGMAYMNEINDKLEGLQSGIDEIQRDMERERDAELRSAFDGLARLALKFEEYGSSPEKRQAGQQIIERALNEADKAWDYQMTCIRDHAAHVRREKKLSPEEIAEESRLLGTIEGRAAVAFQLTATALQMGMRFDGDFTGRRLAADREIADRKAGQFATAHGDAQLAINEKVTKVGGAPLAIADESGDAYEGQNIVLGALVAAGRTIGRVNPIRMREKAKVNIAEKQAKLLSEAQTPNCIQPINEQFESDLDDLDFAFNEADTLVFEDGTVRLLKTADSIAENEK